MLYIGTNCTVHSLNARPELNGRHAVVVTELDAAKGRVGVQVEGEDKPLALKPANLEVVVAPPVEVGAPAAGSSEEGPLAVAVARLMLEDPSSSAKDMHGRLASDAAWADASLSDVRKACSKVKKRGLAAPPVDAAPSGPIDALDDPPAKRIAHLGSMDNCTEFAGALFKMLTGVAVGGRLPNGGTFVKGAQPIGASGLFDELLANRPRAGRRGACYLSLAQLGHALVLETAVDARGELRARPFSAWVFDGGGGELNQGGVALDRDQRRVQRKAGAQGYTASEWAAGARCRWMREQELRAWCARLQQLRERVRVLVEEHLRHGAPPELSLARRRHWAATLVAGCGEEGLMMQPTNVLDKEQVEDYKRQLRRSGHGDRLHCVVFRLPGGQLASAEQLVDFPLTDAAPIADALCELFGEHASAFVWLRMVEFEAVEEGWAFVSGEAKRF